MQSSRTAERRRFWLAVAAIVSAWACLVALVWRPDVPREIQEIARGLFWVGATAALVVARRPGAPFAWLGFERPNRRALLLGVALAVVYLAKDMVRVALFGGYAEFGLALVVSALWTAIIEEMLFRGAIQQRAGELYGTQAAIVASTVLFSAIHYPGWFILGTTPPWHDQLSVFVISLICAGARAWSGQLWPAIAVHWMNNVGARL